MKGIDDHKFQYLVNSDDIQHYTLYDLNEVNNTLLERPDHAVALKIVNSGDYRIQESNFQEDSPMSRNQCSQNHIEDTITFHTWDS